MPLQLQSWNHTSVQALLDQHNASDPVKLIKELCRDLVSQALDKGWSGPPYNPLLLAELYDLELQPDQSIVDACIIPTQEDTFIIKYDPNQRLSRINFSIAHEIGHFLFPDAKFAIRNRVPKKTSVDWQLEYLCNVAASEFLLPYFSFSSDIADVEPEIEQLIKIASSYEASIEAVLLRYIDVTTHNAALLVARHLSAEGSKVNTLYTVSSMASKLDSASFSIPKNSVIYECINPGWTSKGVEKWSKDSDSFNISCLGLPPVRHDNRNRVAALISPTFAAAELYPSITYLFGDATHPQGRGRKIIVQLVNDVGALGAGFGKSMAISWPASAHAINRWKSEKTNFGIGSSQLISLDNTTFAFQMIAQEGLGTRHGSIQLRYTALRKGLNELAGKAKEKKATIHMPRIGAGQAGGDWNIIESMINDELVNKGLSVTVYDIPGSKINKQPNKQLSLL